MNGGIRLARRVLGAPAPIFWLAVVASAQQPAPLGTCSAPAATSASDIERRSVAVPMADGVKLAADVYLPKGASAKLPAILVSTRYWRAGEGQPIGPQEQFWVGHGYALVSIDVRGTGASQGQWYYPWSPLEVMDIGAVVAWIAQQPWSDGQVGSIGTSYTGNTAQLVAASHSPAVKAVVPRFMDFDVYADLTFPGGVVNEMLLRDWGSMVHAMDLNQVPNAPKGVRRLDDDREGLLLARAVKDHQRNPPLNESAKQVTYRDEIVAGFGGASNDLAGTYRYRASIERSGVPIFGWASWLDAGTSQGLVNRFMNWSNPQIAVIGPWSHGGGNHASPYFPADHPTEPPSPRQTEQSACFFDQFMRGKDNGFGKKKLIYYTLGEDRWKETDTWPIAGTTVRRFYLDQGGRLTTARPGRGGSDSYRVDFEATTGTHNRWYTQLGGFDVIYPDRSEQDRRLLTYTSEPLTRDLVVTGQGVVTLRVTSTATDGNFIAYLEDVSPDGKSTYIAEGMLRALHRKLITDSTQQPYRTTYPQHSFKQADAMPLLPGQPADLVFQLIPTSVRLQAGHRIRLALAGADKDTFLRTPATGDVTITVDRTKGASFLELPVVPK